MKPRTLLIWLAVAAGLGLFIYFVERDLPSTTEREELDKKVMALEAEDVEAVEVRRGDKSFRLEKKPATSPADSDPKTDTTTPPVATWELVAQGARWRATTTQVDDLVRRVTDLRKQRTFDSFDPAQTGLATPHAEVTLWVKGKSHGLKVGERLALGDALLVGYGNKAYQVQAGADFFDVIDREAGDWRDKSLFHDGRAKIAKVTLPGPTGATVLARRGETESFWLESPPADLADRDLVSGLLTDITTLEAQRFLEQEPAPLPSLRTLEVAIEGRPTPFRIELAPSADGKMPARVDGQWVEIQGERLLAAADRPAALWRSTFWTPLQVFGIDHATFEQAGQKTEIHRVEGEWRRGAENQDKLDFAVASDALYPLVEVKAQEVLTKAEAAARGFALTNPRLSITLANSDSREELAVYPAVGGLAPATTGSREMVLLLPDDKVQELERKVAAVRTAQPLADAQKASPSPVNPLPPAEEEEP